MLRQNPDAAADAPGNDEASELYKLLRIPNPLEGRFLRRPFEFVTGTGD